MDKALSLENPMVNKETVKIYVHITILFGRRLGGQTTTLIAPYGDEWMN